MLLYFLGAGGFGAAAYVALASLLSYAGMVMWLASAVSFAVLTPLVYLAQHRFTFASKASHRTALPRYLALQALGFTLSWLLPLLLDNKGIPAPVVFLGVAACAALLNFILMKSWAFVPSEKASSK